jgi:hypothetical protein
MRTDECRDESTHASSCRSGLQTRKNRTDTCAAVLQCAAFRVPGDGLCGLRRDCNTGTSSPSSRKMCQLKQKSVCELFVCP